MKVVHKIVKVVNPSDNEEGIESYVHLPSYEEVLAHLKSKYYKYPIKKETAVTAAVSDSNHSNKN